MNPLPFCPRFAVHLIIVTLSLLPLRAQRRAVEGAQGMVASSHVLASQAGAETLRRGGNAVDAAVTTALVLAVVYPQAGNLGGGGFMLVHLADGRDVAIDYRETAPAAASRDMFLDDDGQVRRGPGSSTAGWRASGVPGTVAGLAYALDNYGSGLFTWAELIEAARRLAVDGHELSQGAAAHLRDHATHLSTTDETRRIYLKGGAYWRAGERWRQPELGETLARLQRNGPADFYEGETARRIASAMEANRGTLSLADLAAYRVKERAPLRGTYRGHTIVTMPPPSSGGIALLQMFAMLEPHDVTALGHQSSAKHHLFAEVMRRAFRVRAELLGDPDFVEVPVAGLLAHAYTSALMQDYDPRRVTPSAHVRVATRAPTESAETTHFSIIDGHGNAVANTFTLNGNYGSGVTIPGTGILMNNEMDDFTAKVGATNMFGLLQSEANAIVPGKRPLSSMTPTMVFKDGRLLLVTGSPGGPTIINTVLQVVANVIDFGLPVAQAVEAPRIHHQWMPDVLTYERYGMSADVAEALRARGHSLKERASYEGSYQGGADTVAVDPVTGHRWGFGDPRKPDSHAAGH
jgi:gamma-glutamyltranspeptidase / glutathione hydrolase